jgi:hypothetical protein
VEDKSSVAGGEVMSVPADIAFTAYDHEIAKVFRIDLGSDSDNSGCDSTTQLSRCYSALSAERVEIMRVTAQTGIERDKWKRDAIVAWGFIGLVAMIFIGCRLGGIEIK